MTPLIEATKISKIFTTSDTPFTLFQEISLSIFPKDTIACTGRSGEGKTTLLHILGTLLPPSSGTIVIQGKKATDLDLNQLRNQFFGFIFQSFHLLEEADILSNVLLPMTIARKSTAQTSSAQQRALFLIDQVGLSHRTTTKAKFLSGGEKQRVAIARSLIMDPPIIFADEPTGNLDSATAAPIVELMFEMVSQENKALFLVTHQEDLVHHCRKQYQLHQGKLC